MVTLLTDNSAIGVQVTSFGASLTPNKVLFDNNLSLICTIRTNLLCRAITAFFFTSRRTNPKKNGLFSVMGRITINKKDSVFNTKVEVSSETLLKLFDLQNEQMRVRIGVDLTKQTHSRYVLIRERLAMYLKEKCHVEDISIRKVSLAFIQDFETYMRANVPVNTNMLYKYMQYFRRVVRNAFHSGLIRSYPFSEYKLRKTKAEIPFLTKDELLALMSKRFEIKRLEEIRDIFVFSCFTGLAYVDVKKLGKDEIQPFMDGRDWIVTSRSKTGNAVNVKLFDIPRQIIRKYEGQTIRNYVLPVITNQKTNAYLKETAIAFGIDSIRVQTVDS